MTLYQEWLLAKAEEKKAQDWRRRIEDEMIKALGVETKEETQNFETKEYKIKVSCNFSRKVDADRLQEIAAEHGLSEHLPSLFRWKPEINMLTWKRADASITAPLAEAITTKPGRPSFKIEKKETNNG